MEKLCDFFGTRFLCQISRTKIFVKKKCTKMHNFAPLHKNTYIIFKFFSSFSLEDVVNGGCMHAFFYKQKCKYFLGFSTKIF